ncbi:hypothetical protein HAX54_023681 [Datura stramonium]|uniref:DUF1985 domain-containing protein n=1 Tax=Datura stramonium TaxID=4076 RepID=A0ABS8UWY4_DATST|nr:hypothetical protein [Datura stramonium]
MARELESSSGNALLINVNGTTLHFTQREFTLISSLNCTTDESEFVFDTDVPNRLIHQYFGGDNTRTVNKAKFVDKFEKKVWGNSDDDALKFALVFKNIDPTSRELSILELPSPYVESQIVHPVDNVAEQSDDDFMDVQPLIPTAKDKEKVVESSSPNVLQKSHVEQNAAIRQKIDLVKKYVKDEFDDIRKLINNKFNNLMDVVRVHGREGQYHKPEVASNVPPQQDNLSGEINQNANDGVHNMEELTELHDQNMNSDINKDKPKHMADMQFDQREHIQRKFQGVTIVMPKNTVQTHIGDVHLKDLNMAPSQFEFHDELLLSLNPERSIIVHPHANIQEEVTPLPMQRSAGHDAVVKHEIEKLPELLSIYLSTTDFYKKKGITSSTHPRYNIQTPSDAFEVMDCGIFMATYAEFLSGGEGILNSSIDAEFRRNKYASILWDYATKKLEAESMSDDEAPPKKIRPVVQSSSSYRIVLP